MRWEYLVINGPDIGSGLVDQLNQAGADGWEAVALWHPRKGTVSILLKRLTE